MQLLHDDDTWAGVFTQISEGDFLFVRAIEARRILALTLPVWIAVGLMRFESLWCSEMVVVVLSRALEEYRLAGVFADRNGFVTDFSVRLADALLAGKG